MARAQEIEPQITKFYLPWGARACLVGITFLVYCSVASFRPFEVAGSPFFDLGRSFVDNVVGANKFKYAMIIILISHSIEGVYTWYIARNHTSFFLCILYALSGMCLGYPLISELKYRIGQAKKGKLE